MSARKIKEESYSIGEDDEEYEEEITNLTDLPPDVPNKIEQIITDSMKLRNEMSVLLDRMYQLKSSFITKNNFEALEEHFSQLASLLDAGHPVQITLKDYKVYVGQMAEAALYTTYVIEDLINRMDSLAAFLERAVFAARDNLLEATTVHVCSLIRQMRNRDANPEVVQTLELATLKAEDDVDQEIMDFFEFGKTLSYIKEREKFYVRRLIKTMLDHGKTQRKILGKLLKVLETPTASRRSSADQKH